MHINKYKERTVVNKVASLYSKSDELGNNKIISYVLNQIDKGNLLDASNKKAPNWFTARGLQLPKAVQTILDANNSIPNSAKNVNDSSKNSLPINDFENLHRSNIEKVTELSRVAAQMTAHINSVAEINILYHFDRICILVVILYKNFYMKNNNINNRKS